ncbi:unnamed protein product [Discosporangium mesarthrocarpum]
MIQTQSLVKVIDNSGAKSAKCIKVKSKSGRGVAYLGDIIVLSIQSLKPRFGRQDKLKINKSDIFLGVVVQTRSINLFPQSYSLSFGENAVVLLNSNKKVLGTRISSVLPRALRSMKWAKLATMSKALI